MIVGGFLGLRLADSDIPARRNSRADDLIRLRYSLHTSQRIGAMTVMMIKIYCCDDEHRKLSSSFSLFFVDFEGSATILTHGKRKSWVRCECAQ